MGILSKVTGGALTKILGTALVVTVIAMILMTRYSFTLRASLQEAESENLALKQDSVKQSNLLNAERKSNAKLRKAYEGLDREYENTKTEVSKLPETNGCLAERDVGFLLCDLGILVGEACANPAYPAESIGIQSAPLTGFPGG